LGHFLASFSSKYPPKVTFQSGFYLRPSGQTLVGFHSKLRSYDEGTSENGGGGQRGEICMRGRNVMMGYHGAQQGHAEAFDADGWLLSGDVGQRDEEGFVAIVGRIKEILVTAGGENVAPVPLEEAIVARLPGVGHAVLVGDRRKFVACLLTLKVEIMDSGSGYARPSAETCLANMPE